MKKMVQQILSHSRIVLKCMVILKEQFYMINKLIAMPFLIKATIQTFIVITLIILTLTI